MKTFFIALVSMIIVTLSHSNDVIWTNNYEKALQKAHQENKDIYLFIGADNCKFCDRFNALTLSKKNIIDKLQEEYILLYLSRDQHKVPHIFSTIAVPRHYFITKKEKIIFESYGMPEPNGFLLLLDEVDLNRED